MQSQKNERLCMYYQRGHCKFKNNCRFSHTIVQTYLIRHAQSEFNLKLESSQHDSYSEKAKQQYQFDSQLIDCGITQNGINQIANISFPQQLIFNKQIQVDAIFVSPLERALISTQLMLKFHKIRYHKIIILPNLTQVLSKICDFCAPIQPKYNKYNNFDFSYFKQALKGKQEKWQDDFVNQSYSNLIDGTKQFGERYVKVLQQVFPQPLQTNGSCYARSMKLIGEMKKICLKQNYRKILVVSHNRILKNIAGRQEIGKKQGLLNCEIRATQI